MGKKVGLWKGYYNTGELWWEEEQFENGGYYRVCFNKMERTLFVIFNWLKKERKN